MNIDNANNLPLPLPLAVALATIGAAGGGGAGAWAFLAARGLSHPAVQQAAASAAGTAAFAGAHAVEGIWHSSSLGYMLVGATIAAAGATALLAACALGGGLAGAAAWSHTRARQTQTEANPTAIADLQALATQIARGGPPAAAAMATRLQLEPDLVAEWATAWVRAAEGPRSYGRQGPRAQTSTTRPRS